MYRFAYSVVLWLLVASWAIGSVWAQPNKKEGNEEDPQILLEEFELDAQNVVISAAKVKTTIQEAPGIITVITAKEIRERGYRTVNEILQNLPGFHGDRWEGSGWFKESFARGVPRGLLILMNGINIVEPVRNTLSMDRKIAVNMIHRIEVTSGPGGVLWGSNALLGIVNIITKNGDTMRGLEVQIGYGTGPGEVHGIKASVSYGGKFLNGLLKVYVFADLFTSQGPNLRTNDLQILGVLPEPNNFWSTQLVEGMKSTPKFLKRKYWLNTFAKVDIWKFSIEAYMPWERDHLELAPAGEQLTYDYTDLSKIGTNRDLATTSQDWVRWVALKYKDRYLEDKIGLSVTTYYTDWKIRLEPFGIYPKGTLSPHGIKTKVHVNRMYRVGTNVDMDFKLPANHRLIFGGEFFFEEMHNAQSWNWDPTANPGQTFCSQPFVLRPDIDPVRPCVVFEKMAFDTNRMIGAVFLVEEWKAHSSLILTAGVRGQFSNTYDPAVLFQAGLVWNIWKKIYVKINYSEGFRAPDFQSTHLNDNVTGSVTWKPNPDLEVETSRSVDTEINMIFLENVGVFRKLYLRLNYGFTKMDNVINRPGGKFQNSGERELHTLEFLMRMIFKGDHEVFLGYYFFSGHDSATGAMRNVPNHILTGGFRAHLYKKYIELVATFTLRGGLEDRNLASWPITEPGANQPYNVIQKNGIDVVSVLNTEQIVEKVPAAIIVNAGIRVKNVWKKHLEFNIFVYNVANLNYGDPDLFNDGRTFAQTYAKPRISFFFSTVFRYF